MSYRRFTYDTDVTRLMILLQDTAFLQYYVLRMFMVHQFCTSHHTDIHQLFYHPSVFLMNYCTKLLFPNHHIDGQLLEMPLSNVMTQVP